MLSSKNFKPFLTKLEEVVSHYHMIRRHELSTFTDALAAHHRYGPMRQTK